MHRSHILSLFRESGFSKEDVIIIFLFVCSFAIFSFLLYHIVLTCESISSRRSRTTLPPSESNVVAYIIPSRIYKYFADKSSKRHHRQQQNEQKTARRKPNREYLKPKLLVQELRSIWDTTYTVVAWGSYYIIGGTIVATEKLCIKIKKKCRREERGLVNGSSRGTGLSEFDTSFESEDGDSVPLIRAQSSTSSSNNSFQRISSWTKKSYSASKRKVTRIFTPTTTRQITGPLEADELLIEL